MLDFNNIISTPGLDVQYFNSTSTVTLTQWQTWRKPRGAKMVYILGVGGGSSGAVGANTSATNAGGQGGGSGAQSNVLIPATFIPDTLYIQCGAGGQQPDTLVSGATQVGGVPTYVSIEPSTTLTSNMLLLSASGGASGTNVGGTVATIANMPLAARGIYSFYAGQNSGNGGSAGAGAGNSIGFPSTGIMVMAGACGGGGGSATGGAGGVCPSSSTTFFATNFYLNSPAFATGATGSTPAGAGRPGIILPYFLGNYGGGGGGGANTNAAGLAGRGANGAPGCGGGGSGGCSTAAPTLARPGDGGNGFVLIISW